MVRRVGLRGGASAKASQGWKPTPVSPRGKSETPWSHAVSYAILGLTPVHWLGCFSFYSIPPACRLLAALAARNRRLLPALPCTEPSAQISALSIHRSSAILPCMPAACSLTVLLPPTGASPRPTYPHRADAAPSGGNRCLHNLPAPCSGSAEA